MKKITYILVSFFCLLGTWMFSSCNDLLDITPRTSIDPEVIMLEDIPTLLNGCYDAASFGGSQNKHLFLISEDLSADNLTVRGTGWGTDVVDRNLIPTDNANVTRWWNHCFVVVYRCNSFLKTIESFPESSFEAQHKKNMVAQARYIRAWAYYQLVTHWGGVPILQKVTNELVSRNTEPEVWTFIYDELTAIEPDAPEFANPSYVSKPAIQALLARVALIMNDRETAKVLSKSLIDNKQFELADDFETIWDKESKEIIMQWQATVNDPLSYGYFLSGTTGRYEMPVDVSLVEAFEEGDNRKNATIGLLTKPIGGFSYECKKYWRTQNGDDPWPVARIAEAFLIYAEAVGYPEGLTTLNLLRQKRGLKAVDVKSQEAFQEAILKERRLEFAFEGLRWTDLKRMKRVSEFVPHIKDENDPNILYPIPRTAMDTNPNLKPNY